ncbi:hypothetical protein C1J03_08685 [Sulfitobacter sp. SK012]|uniref:DUF5333 domain-containing protein n=1 Tax=Sulfitobacter sp. SK012 TaxID=1389005 RepID=UPI000E0A97EE|nr:DUF5333 domain-containing protein [Sulfitobacter sp. SK012]AXI46086.1 hypothetical protein C1J03_08685 [Sulfitobacter sp. SK012]
MRGLLIAFGVMAILANPVAAKPPLRDVPKIDNALLDLGIADIIRKQCPDISARMLKALNYVWGLKAEAGRLGYTDAEIDAYIDSDAEKTRMRARGDEFFKARGVETSDPQSYCALGRAEIQKSSRIGSLLKAK